MADLTPEQLHALDIARELVKAGVPVFVAPPCPGVNCDRRGHNSGRVEFHLPARWQTSKPNLDVVDRWRPGWALCAVMGHTLDLIDVDPRNGGDASMTQLMEAGKWPLTYARAATPSGGIHEFIAPLRAGSHDAVAPGIDVKGGLPDGTSRGFAYIAPTVRVSKTTGKPAPYRWILEPLAIDTDGDNSGAAIAELVHKARRGGKHHTVDGFEHPAGSPWLDIPATLSEARGGRRRGVMKLAAALRGRGGWRVDDALAYMRAVVWPQIDQQQSGHPFTWEELEATVRDVFNRYPDGPSSLVDDDLDADDADGHQDATDDQDTDDTDGHQDATDDQDTDGDAPGNERMGPTARRAMSRRPPLHIGSPAVAVEWLRENVGTGRLAGFFLRDGEMVHCPAEGEDGYIPPSDDRDHDGPAQVRPVTAGQLRARVQAAYNCYRVKEQPDGTRKRVAALFPREAAPFIIDAPDTAPNLRPLAGVTHTPLVRRDGTILDRPGYDPATRLLYLPDPGMTFAPVPEQPSPELVQAAVAIIDKMIGDFPFVSVDDKANYIGLLLTPLLRELVPPPYKLGVFTAPMRRSGKTLLATLLRIIHGGVFRAEAPTDEAEWLKTISAILNVTTGPVVCFDNVTGTLKSGTLDGVLTSAQFDARQLGSTKEMISRRNDRLWIITSNNAQLGGDLIPRSLWVKIDPGEPHPEQRTGFTIPDLPAWVQDNRGAILTALLTLVRAWVVAGQPQERGGDIFGRWVGAVRGILHVAGIPGTFDAPTSRGQSVSDEDEEAAVFLAAVERVFGEQSWTAGDVISRVDYGGDIYPTGGIPADCLPQVVASRPREVHAKVLGYWLRWRVNAWFGDNPARRLCPAGERKKTNLYRIESR